MWIDPSVIFAAKVIGVLIFILIALFFCIFAWFAIREKGPASYIAQIMGVFAAIAAVPALIGGIIWLIQLLSEGA